MATRPYTLTLSTTPARSLDTDPFGAGNYMVVAAEAGGSFSYHDAQCIPAIELPANCQLRLRVLPNPAAGALFQWTSIEMRLLYRRETGQAQSMVANEGLLQPSGFGDQ